jgi:Uma2 family endonuclease
MAVAPKAAATVDDLAREPGKAELIGGRIVRLKPTGRLPSRIAKRIVQSLDDFAERTGLGEAFTDNMGFVVPVLPSGRQSFCPDASFYVDPFPANSMRFVTGPPTLAVEVRSENDYGPAAEREMAAKRADYFAAGTDVVWDVDTLGEQVHVYRASDPLHPVTFTRGQTAEAEPAAPGWTVAVDWIFR